MFELLLFLFWLKDEFLSEIFGKIYEIEGGMVDFG
jgi:hypothetical protein